MSRPFIYVWSAHVFSHRTIIITFCIVFEGVVKPDIAPIRPPDMNPRFGRRSSKGVERLAGKPRHVGLLWPTEAYITPAYGICRNPIISYSRNFACVFSRAHVYACVGGHAHVCAYVRTCLCVCTRVCFLRRRMRTMITAFKSEQRLVLASKQFY